MQVVKNFNRAVIDRMPIAVSDIEFKANQEYWYEQARIALRKRLQYASDHRPYAKNVVLFVGDGMGVATSTAARILRGQRLGKHGEDHELAWDSFPAVALAKCQTTTENPTVTSHVLNNFVDSQVLLSTAAIRIKDHKGQLQLERVLLDKGSQSSFITEELSQRLNLRRFPTNLAVRGREVSVILSSAGFHLRKRLTNRPEISDQFEITDANMN
ncbi:hypothetical protein JTB14_037331 [Gonioctena quinquepunctata]|nr:hypothetical protein JTB14_037331 [Gonioctena quinquepunctata]